MAEFRTSSHDRIDDGGMKRACAVGVAVAVAIIASACALEDLSGYSSGGPPSSSSSSGAGDAQGGSDPEATAGTSSSGSSGGDGDGDTHGDGRVVRRECPANPADAGSCSGCVGGGCTSEGTCEITCASGSCNGSTVRCPAGRPCRVLCGPNSCSGLTIECPTTASCTLECRGGGCVGTKLDCKEGRCVAICETKDSVVAPTCENACECDFRTCSGGQ
jgi:hypothetical protein